MLTFNIYIYTHVWLKLTKGNGGLIYGQGGEWSPGKRLAGEGELGQTDRPGQRGRWNRGGLIYRQSGEWNLSRRLAGEREPGQRGR